MLLFCSPAPRPKCLMVGDDLTIMPTMNAGSFNYRETQWIILLLSDSLLHTPSIWHRQTTEDGPVIIIIWTNSDSCLGLKAIMMAADLMRAHSGKKWHSSVWSEAYSQDIMGLQSCWDACAFAKFLARLDGMKLVKRSFWSRDFSQLTERDTCNISVCVYVWARETLFLPRPLTLYVLRSHTLTDLSCSAVNVSVMGLIAGAACQIPTPHPCGRLPPVPFFSPPHFERILKESGVHTKRKQSCISLDYWDCVGIHRVQKNTPQVSHSVGDTIRFFEAPFWSKHWCLNKSSKAAYSIVYLKQQLVENWTMTRIIWKNDSATLLYVHGEATLHESSQLGFISHRYFHVCGLLRFWEPTQWKLTNSVWRTQTFGRLPRS